ncbi:programmed cell death protein 7-like isoform X2 [Homarus americanus]|nr:programmed cell death protein 7-like isoform X2 [Homarus americanus]
MVTESQMLASSLREVEEKMNQVRETAQIDVWEDLAQQAEKIKLKLKQVIIGFQDDNFICSVQKLINQRRMKRKHVKRRKKEIQLEKEQIKKARQEEEEKIDAWREKLEVEAEEKRREKAIKAEADSILGEVRQKQNDTLRMQQLLEALITLRLTRINKGAAHGDVSTPQRDQRFASTIKGIGDVVRSQMKEYELEEQTLCVMMEESASHQSCGAGKKVKLLRREAVVKKLLFGDYPPLDETTTQSFTSADDCLETLIKRRCDWDQFITDDDNPLASSVPLHWVNPPSHPTTHWAQFQVQ